MHEQTLFVYCLFLSHVVILINDLIIPAHKEHTSKPTNAYGWFYKLALLDFELIFEVKMQESEGV